MDEDMRHLTRELDKCLARFAMTYRRKVINDYAPYGLRAGTIVVVEAIAQGADTPSEIANMLSLVLPQVTATLNKLQRSGYVERAINEADRRRVKISFTDAGQEMLRQVSEARLQRLTPFLAMLSDEAAAQFNAHITELRERLDAGS